MRLPKPNDPSTKAVLKSTQTHNVITANAQKRNHEADARAKAVLRSLKLTQKEHSLWRIQVQQLRSASSNVDHSRS